jgi:hypothetical protein
MKPVRIALAVLLGSLFVSCSSKVVRKFDIKTINSDGEAVPCVVKVEGEIWPDPEDPNKPFMTNDFKKRVELTFKPRDDGAGMERFELSVIALQKDAKGKIDPNSWQAAPESRPYLMTERPRQLRYNDPEVHLFIMRENPNR